MSHKRRARALGSSGAREKMYIELEDDKVFGRRKGAKVHERIARRARLAVNAKVVVREPISRAARAARQRVLWLAIDGRGRAQLGRQRSHNVETPVARDQ
eukprot:1724663-Prymnesium_polylepis.1